MRNSGPIVLARAGEIRLPVLLVIGGSDPIIDPESNRRLFRSLGSEDKTLLEYPEMRHEPLNEVGRARVLTDMELWLEPRLASR